MQAFLRTIVLLFLPINFIEKEKQLNVKTYPKETESLRNILKSINTLDNIDDNYHETETILSDEEDTNVYTNNLDDE